MTEIELSEHLSKKLKTEHDITNLSTDWSVTKINNFAKNCFDGCVDFGVINYSLISKFIKEKKNSKVVIFAEGPDELLGGYAVDVEAYKIDNIFLKRKYLSFFLKHKLLKKLVIKFLKLKKNVEFEYNFRPFYTRVNHLVCPNNFLKNII